MFGALQWSACCKVLRVSNPRDSQPQPWISGVVDCPFTCLAGEHWWLKIDTIDDDAGGCSAVTVIVLLSNDASTIAVMHHRL